MIVWGGEDGLGSSGTTLATGAIYDPATVAWTTITTTGAPGTRTNHTAVWTGWAHVE